MYGFEKKERAGIRPDELAAFQALAAILLNDTPERIKRRMEDGEIFSVWKDVQDDGEVSD